MSNRYDPLSISTQVQNRLDRRNAGVERGVQTPASGLAASGQASKHAQHTQHASDHDDLIDQFMQTLFGAMGSAPSQSAPPPSKSTKVLDALINKKEQSGTSGDPTPLNKYGSSLPAIKNKDGSFSFQLQNTSIGKIEVTARQVNEGLVVSLHLGNQFEAKKRALFERMLSSQLSSVLGVSVKVVLNA